MFQAVHVLLANTRCICVTRWFHPWGFDQEIVWDIRICLVELRKISFATLLRHFLNVLKWCIYFPSPYLSVVSYFLNPRVYLMKGLKEKQRNENKCEWKRTCVLVLIGGRNLLMWGFLLSAWNLNGSKINFKQTELPLSALLTVYGAHDSCSEWTNFERFKQEPNNSK